MEQDVLKTILNKLDKMDSKIDKLETKITGIESNIATLNSRQDETYKIVKAIHHRQDVGDSKFDALQSNLITLKEEQARQGRALEVLSARSIEHEAELKRVL